MAYRPRIDDPTDGFEFDDRERCPNCGKSKEFCYCDDELGGDEM